MKPIYRLAVAGDDYPLENHDITLELNSPGRGFFIVESDHSLTGIVIFRAGYSPDTINWFYGYVESCTALNDKQQKIFCRELTAGLNRQITIGLRHPTLKTVLVDIAGQTGLIFQTPDTDYSRAPIAHYYHSGGGYYAMDCLAAAFQIEKFIWQQQGDGRVFVGSWADSDWAKKQTITIPAKQLIRQASNASGKIPMIPRLRPGVAAEIAGQPVTITTVALNGDQMTITWDKNPWSERLKRKGAA